MNILLVTARYPWPARRGDQLRAAQMLALLAPEHRVTLLTPAPAGSEPQPAAIGAEVITYRAPGGGWAGAGGVARAALRGLPLQSGLFFSPDLGRQLRQLAQRADLVVLQLVRLAVHREDVGTTPLLVDLIDDLALNFARRAEVDRRWLRPALVLEARLLARAQRWLTGQACGVLLVCERDRRELVQQLPVALANRVGVAALAMEPGPPPPLLSELSSASAGRLGSPVTDGPPRLVFTGNLGYFVNADAISWWLREVWPEIAARRPGLRLVVAGDRPAAAVRQAVARAGEGTRSASVSLVESVADLKLVLAGATAALAPMRCGSGMPIKVLEAWSAGVPVVASAWAAAGTSGVPGEDLLIADSARQWTDALSALLDDAAERRRLAANGWRRLTADYSRERVKRQLLAAAAAAVA